MSKSTKKASSRIFYTAPRHWKIWRVLDWAWTPAALVLICLIIFLTIALQYSPV